MTYERGAKTNESRCFRGGGGVTDSGRKGLWSLGERWRRPRRIGRRQRDASQRLKAVPTRKMLKMNFIFNAPRNTLPAS